MERTLAVLNDLVRDGVVGQYAIGGAVGAIFWIEPIDTIDLDVFVLLPPSASSLDPLRGIITYLAGRGYGLEGEFFKIEGVYVQFLPAEDATGLREAALTTAVDHAFLNRVPTRVMKPEYLVALALETHRSKDYDRVDKLLTQATCDRGLIASLVATHRLSEYWKVFIHRYPEHG